MARALVHFAQEDSVAQLIAEGIESEAEASTLVELGVHLGQGYFFGRPGPVGQLRSERAWHMVRPLPRVKG